MAKIPKKPTRRKVDEATIEAVIEKGGSAPQAGNRRKKKEIKTFLVYASPDLISLVDQAVDGNPAINKRNTWVLLAIQEKLKREGIV